MIEIQPGIKLKTFRRSVEAPFDYQPGEFRLSIHLAAKKQAVQLYAVSLEVFPQGTDRNVVRTDGISWKPRGHMVKKDWSPTAQVEAYDELVRKKWWTTEQGSTSSSGHFVTRAFKGKHLVTVKHGDYEWSKLLELMGGKTLEVSVP